MAKLPINENFFKTWTSEMSYILGFVVADGCIGVKRIRKRDGVKQYFFNITSKDKSHLENIKKAMAAQQKIYSKSSGYTNRKNYYFIQVGHQEICKDLINLGILPRKTYNLNSIKVPDKYFPDFVRGFFDGDGSVYIYEVNRTPQVKASFVSPSLSFIAELNQQLCKKLGIPTKSIHQTTDKRAKRMIQYSICFYVEDCEKLANFMYGNNPTLYLPRKRRVFERWQLIKRRHYIKQNYPSKVGWHLNQKVLA
jgi:hypothetical protein